MAENNGKKNQIDQKTIIADVATLGVNIAVGFAVFTFIGYKIDEHKGGGQMWTLTGMFVGLFYCGYSAWKMIREKEKQNG